jgi:hypothetical protein
MLFDMRGAPPVLSQEQIDELVTTVLDVFHYRHPLTLPEIRGIARKRFNKEIISDTLYRNLADHIVRVLDGSMAAGVPDNIMASFGNAGVSLLLDDDRVIRCVVTPETTRCLLGTPFSASLQTPEEEDLDLLGCIDSVRSRDIESVQGGMVTPDSSKQDRGNFWKTVREGLLQGSGMRVSKSQAMTHVEVIPSVWINPRSLFLHQFRFTGQQAENENGLRCESSQS